MYNFVTLFLELGVFLSDLTLVLLAAGSSSRFASRVKKQWLRVDHAPLWLFVAKRFAKILNISNVIITASKDEIAFMENYSDFKIIEGGATRQRSLQNALKHVTTPYVLVSDIARACISEPFLKSIIAKKGEADVIVPFLKVSDTVVFENNTIDRDKVMRIQTPQLSKTSIIRQALDTDVEYTDESSAIAAIGGSRLFVEGEEDAHKITFASDLAKIPCLLPPSADTLSGNGFDVHAFEEGKTMVLGGVKIDASYGFKAHSDGDVAIHALIDALLGAAGMGDIGMLFPDNDDTYKGIDSKFLLQNVVNRLHAFGFEIINVDITIAAQKPRLGDYKLQMRTTLASILGIDRARVNVKATTTEKLGFIGRSEGVGVIANANLKYFDWTKI